MIIKRGLKMYFACLVTFFQPSLLCAQVGGAQNGDVILVKNLREIYPSNPVLVESYGVCDSQSTIINLPSVVWRVPSYGYDKMSQLKYALGENKDLMIYKDASGVAVIRRRGLASKLLPIKIDNLKFDENQQYSVELAMIALLKSAPVKKTMSDLDMKSMPKFGGLISGPDPGQPHLVGALNGQTFESVILSIVSKFQGIMVYKECSLKNGSKRFSYDYYYPQ